MNELSIVEERLGLMHVGKADLNLLKPLQALLEECNIGRAAKRCGLSQSAMSRSLDRLRLTFKDELLVRFEGGWTLTARANRLLPELREILPRLEIALRGDNFDPSSSRHTIRIATTEYGGAVVIPLLYARVRQEAPRAQVEVLPWSSRGLENVIGGQVDFAIVSLHDTKELQAEALFVDSFACVVAKDHPLRNERPRLEAYLLYPHVECLVADGGTPLIDATLTKHGVRRRVAVYTAYPLAGMRVISGTDLIFTLPRRLAVMIAPLVDGRVIDAPIEFADFTYATAYHPRLEQDAMQIWIRSLVKDVTRDL